MRILPVTALIPFLVAAALAQPAEVSRVLRTIDFEERGLGNVEELPMHWLKVEGHGLPHYVNGRLATDRAHSGDHSFRFDLNGGGVIYRYDTGLIKVRSGAHYSVECVAQTTPLDRARARLTAYMTDLDGHRIESSVTHSELYASANDHPRWHKLKVELSAEDANAAYLVIELGLLQPMHYAPSSLGERTLFTQEIRGSAWFDDVTVSQVPRITMSTDRPGNIFRADDPLRLQVLVNDRFTDDLAAQLRVRDAEGKTVFQQTGALDMSAAEDLGPGRKRMSLALPDLQPGWYEATLLMTSQGQFVGEHSLDLVLLADSAPPVIPDKRFGIVATHLPFDGWHDLPDILPFLSAGRVKLAVWSDAGDVEQMDSAAFDHLLERLQELQITPTACLLSLPPTLAKQMNGEGWLQLLRPRQDQWRAQLSYLIARHANHLDRWQLGEDGTAAFVTDPGMREVYKLVYREFANLIQHPDLAMPWPAWYELEGEMPATVALSVPPSVLPHQLPLYMQDIARHEGQNLSLSLELIDREQYGREMQIRDLTQRVVYALAAGANRIDIPLPFNVTRSGDNIERQPQELLMIVRTLVTTLAGTEFRGKVPIGEGVEAFLFDQNGKGILVLWDRGSQGGVKELSLNLGRHPMRMDLWGRVTPLLQTGSRKSAAVNLAFGTMPIILLDIDGNMAQLRASVALDRPLLESSFQPHSRRVRFTNPYRNAIAGTMKLRAPSGWVLNPPTFMFSLNPGETFDREITIEFPYNSFAGAKTIDAEFILQGEENNAFTVPIALKLGLSDVGMQTIALRDGNDVVVQQMITNYGDRPIDYTAFAIFPGQARQERLVTGLGPGRTTIKRYRFSNVQFPPDARVRSGVKELIGTRILNEEIAIQ